MGSKFSKFAGEEEDFGIDWTGKLAGDTIASSSWTLPAGLVLGSNGQTNTTSQAVVWIAGGTAGETYTVKNTIQTAAGRTLVGEIELRIKPHSVLTETEAATVLRCAEDDPNMLDLLPLVDAYLTQATGRDWAEDSPVHPAAKSAARMLLVRWHEDPGGMAAGNTLAFGLRSAIVQLRTLAFELAEGNVPGEGLVLVSSVPPAGYSGFSVGGSLVLIFNHALGPGAVNQVSLATAAGVAVATTNSLDPTGKVLTIRPDAPLAAAAGYVLDIDQAADVYGLTLDTELEFTTA